MNKKRNEDSSLNSRDIIKLDKVAFMISSNSTMPIYATTNAKGNIEWKSSDNTIATVTSDGFVKGIKHGDAIITATFKEVSAKCRVSVDYNGQNPTLPPTWGLFIPDGEPHVFNDRMYIYGSRDVTNGFYPDGERDFCSKDYHVIYSDDHINWVDAGVAVSMSDIPKDIVGDGFRLWAPDAFKCPINDKYYIAACTNRGKYILLEATSPVGPFTNAIEITLNGESIKTIDPGVLVDTDGKVYIAIMGFHIAQLDPNDYTKILPETYTSVRSSMPNDNEPFEGPSLRRRGDTYYYIYIQNKGNIARDGAVPTIMGYMTSKKPLGPYTYQGVIITNYDYPASGNIHGSIEEYKDQWYVSYHMPLAELQLTRMHYLDKLEFNEDGTIIQAVPTSSGAKGPFSKHEKIQASSGIVFSGGRNNVRLQTRKQPTEIPYGFEYYDYPYAYFIEKDQLLKVKP